MVKSIKKTARPRIGDIADILQPAQVLLVSRADWKGKPIMRATRSIWTHAALIEETAGGVWVVIEAVAAGVVGRRFEHYLEDEHYGALLVRDFPAISLPERQAVCQAMWLQVGQGYDLLGLLGFYVKRRLEWNIGAKLNMAGRQFCSEGVSLAYANAMRVSLTGDPPGLTSPADLACTGLLQDVWGWP